MPDWRAENPVMRFSQSVHRLKRKYHLSGGISYDIKGEMPGTSHRDSKTRLKLPKAADIDRFLAEHIGPEFQRISKEAAKGNDCGERARSGVHAALRRGRTVRGWELSVVHGCAIADPKPVYTALKSKTDQLKKSNATGPLGIFLCDGGCSFSKAGPQPQQVSLDRVVGEFFRQNSSIAFVVVLVFPERCTLMSSEASSKRCKVTGRVYTNPRAANPVAEKSCWSF